MLNNTKSHQKQRLTKSEEERERIRAYDREWLKIHRQDCHMEDCSLDSCDIFDEDVEIHCRELKQYAIQIETNDKIYGFQDEDFVFDSDSKKDESNPCEFLMMKATRVVKYCRTKVTIKIMKMRQKSKMKYPLEQVIATISVKIVCERILILTAP